MIRVTNGVPTLRQQRPRSTAFRRLGHAIMRLLPEKLFGHDIDDLFAYPTTKFVRIRDARLGIFKTILAISVVLYVGICEIPADLAHLDAPATRR